MYGEFFVLESSGIYFKYSSSVHIIGLPGTTTTLASTGDCDEYHIRPDVVPALALEQRRRYCRNEGLFT